MRTSAHARPAVGEGFPRTFVVTSAALLTLLDFSSLLLAGWLTQEWFSKLWVAAGSPGAGWSTRYVVVIAAVVAAMMLHDKQFGARVRRAEWSALARSYVTCFLLFACGVLVIG